MNSPGPFAVVMMAGLLFAFGAPGAMRLAFAVPGYIAFLLTLVRSAWLGCAVGACFMVVRARGPQKIRLLAVGGLLCLPLILLGPGEEAMTSRFQSLQNVGEDGSFGARLRAYGNYTLVAMANWVGEGIGSTNLAALKLGAQQRGQVGLSLGDTGPLEVLFTLGWPGSILYLGGLGWLVSQAFSGRAQRTDLAAQAAGAAALGTLAQLLAVNTLVGVMGMVFWTFLGLMLSARVFSLEEAK